MTNGEYIRSLSDEELAKVIDNIADKVMTGTYCELLGMCGKEKASCFVGTDNSGCIECVLAWLKQERKD
jgi:hypothetical protein